MARAPIRDENDEQREFVVCLSAYTEVVVVGFDEDDAVEKAKQDATGELTWEVDAIHEQ